MNKILLVSHGQMAMGMYEAAKMIIGDCANLDYVCLSKEKNVEMFKQELQEKKEWLKDCDHAYVLADLIGGSPYTTSLSFLQAEHLLEKTKVIAGMNLPLLMTMLIKPDLEFDDINDILNEVKNSISMFEILEEDDEL